MFNPDTYVSILTQLPYIGLIILSALTLELVKIRIIRKILHKEMNNSLKSNLYLFIGSLKWPLSIVIWFTALAFIVRVFESCALGTNSFFQYFSLAQKIVLILALSWICHRFISNVERQTLKINNHKEAINPTSIHAISKILKVLLYAAVLLIILPILGVPTTGVLALGGVSGLAIGIASKDILGNLLAGITLYIERPFSIGDTIETADKKIEGRVKNIGFRSTEVQTLDKRLIYVPNSTFSSVSIINTTRRKHRAIYETVSICYKDIDKVLDITSDIESMLKSHPSIDASETIHTSLKKLNDSSISILVWCYSNETVRTKYYKVIEDILLKIALIIKENGAEISYPTQRIIVDNT